MVGSVNFQNTLGSKSAELIHLFAIAHELVALPSPLSTWAGARIEVFSLAEEDSLFVNSRLEGLEDATVVSTCRPTSSVEVTIQGLSRLIRRHCSLTDIVYDLVEAFHFNRGRPGRTRKAALSTALFKFSLGVDGGLGADVNGGSDTKESDCDFGEHLIQFGLKL